MFEVVENDDGGLYIVDEEGRGIQADVVLMMFELHKQNPRFFESWLELAENYLFVGPDVTEA